MCENHSEPQDFAADVLLASGCEPESFLQSAVGESISNDQYLCVHQLCFLLSLTLGGKRRGVRLSGKSGPPLGAIALCRRGSLFRVGVNRRNFGFARMFRCVQQRAKFECESHPVCLCVHSD